MSVVPTPIEQHQSRSSRVTPRRPTMDDVAAAAGVSRATVSRALSDGHNVSSATMATIRDAVRRTGYVVNEHARSLATHRSEAVAFLLGTPHRRLAEDPTFNILLSACTRALAAHRLTLFLAVADDPDERARVCQHVAGGQMAGALVISAKPGCPLVRDLHNGGVPLVVHGVPVVPGLEVAYVATDDRGGAQQLVRHLRDQGRRTIATITGPANTMCGMQRLAGWRDLLGRAATDQLVAAGDYTSAGGRAAMTRLLKTAPSLDAVFVASDLMAAGALAALREAGRRVPEDVAVGAFGDSPIASTVQPTLTTIRQPLPRIADEMVRLLLELIDGRPAATVLLPTELIVRGST